MRQSLLGSGPSLYKRRSAGDDLFRLGAPVGPGAFNQEDDTDSETINPGIMEAGYSRMRIPIPFVHLR